MPADVLDLNMTVISYDVEITKKLTDPMYTYIDDFFSLSNFPVQFNVYNTKIIGHKLWSHVLLRYPSQL